MKSSEGKKPSPKADVGPAI
jgi:hypothetical protein